jgi:hypothetical protein
MSLTKINLGSVLFAVALLCGSVLAQAAPAPRVATPAPRPFGDHAALADLIQNGQESRAQRFRNAVLRIIGIETDVAHVDAPRLSLASKDRKIRYMATIITVPGSTPRSTVRHLVLAEYRRMGSGETLNEQWTYLRYDSTGALVSVRRISTGVAVADVAAEDRPAIEKAQLAVWNAYRERIAAAAASKSKR